MTQKESLDWLASLEFFGIKLGLEQTRLLFDRLGNPEKQLKFIHVAGSNGKGSVCAYIESALRETGCKTGFYSSPHLVHPCERFRVNGVPCSEEKLSELIGKIRPVVDGMSREGMKATYFEVTTAIAAMLFAEEKTDFVLWETGMGGRLDATNIIRPIVSVITGISMEHSERLGDSLEKIAFEKAGIIKDSVPVFCSNAIPPEALETIRAKASELHAPLYLASGVDNHSVETTLLQGMKGVSQKFRLDSGDRLEIPLPGTAQRNNAALAWEVLKFLAQKYGFDKHKALKGFPKTYWPARMQFLPEYRLIIDAAHNPEGVESLVEALSEIFPDQKFHFIFGAFADKDFYRGLELLAPHALSFRFVAADSSRSTRSPDDLCKALKQIAADIPAAPAKLNQSLFVENKNDTWKILCGSIHLCGEVIKLLNIKPYNI